MSALLASDAALTPFDQVQPVTVNGKTISTEAIYRELQYHPAESPEEAIYTAARALVIAELLRQRAVEAGHCPADCEPGDAEFDRVVEQLLSVELNVPEPAEQDCRLYFEKNRQKFNAEPLAEVRHILFAAAATDEDVLVRARASAAQLLDQVQASGDALLTFAELAKSHSDCSSKSSAGSLGQIGRGDTVAPFEQAVFTQGVGLVPQPVETKYGVHLIYVEHCEAGQPLEFDYVRERITDYLREASRRKMAASYMQSLVESADIDGIDLDGELKN